MQEQGNDDGDNGGDSDRDGASMMQRKDPKETQKKVNSKGKSHCYHCGEDGHYAKDCPKLEPRKRAGLFLQDGVMISQVKHDGQDIKPEASKRIICMQTHAPRMISW
jgi:hypothetical protein